MRTKPFSQELHDNNDPIARQVVIKFLKSINIDNTKVYENPNKFGIDILIDIDNKVSLGIEVERRHSWSDDIFPFSSIHIPYRKGKFAQLSFPTFYYATNKELSSILILDFEDIITSECVENRYKYVSEGECFYNVPTNKARFINIIHI